MPTPATTALAAGAAGDLQDALDAWVSGGNGVHGATAAVVSDRGIWAGAAGVDGSKRALVPESWKVQDTLKQLGTHRQGSLGGPPDYNNLNYMVAGLMIEQVRGVPLAQALREDLLDAGGLTRVWLQDGDRPQPPLTVGHDGTDFTTVDPAGPWMPSRSIASAAAGAGGIAADAPNLAQWGYLLYGGHILDAPLVLQMTTQGDWGGDYGLGTMLFPDEEPPAVGHSGDIYSYHSILLVWPEDHTSIAVLAPDSIPASDEVDMTISEFASQLHQLTAGDKVDATPSP